VRTLTLSSSFCRWSRSEDGSEALSLESFNCILASSSSCRRSATVFS